jgi:hypothetical protein
MDPFRDHNAQATARLTLRKQVETDHYEFVTEREVEATPG